MLLNSKSINNDILKQASAFFSTIHIQQSLSLLNRGEVTISFKKGSMDRFLIVTGICNDRGDQETKIVYKKRLEDVEGETPFTTTCTCDHWTEEKNCPHGAALLLLILLEEMSNEFENDSYQIEQGKEHRPPSHLGVGVAQFGTIIKSPSKLINSGQKRLILALAIA